MKRPSQKDLNDAVRHADLEGNGWTLDDFTLKYIGKLTTRQLREYEDIDVWRDLDRKEFLAASPIERKRMIESFRGKPWARRAETWLPDSIPSVVLVTAPIEANGGELYTQIGDGRGRVNFAEAFGLRLPVWHLVYRHHR